MGGLKTSGKPSALKSASVGTYIHRRGENRRGAEFLKTRRLHTASASGVYLPLYVISLPLRTQFDHQLTYI